MDLDAAIIEVLVTMFHELRNGQTMDGRSRLKHYFETAVAPRKGEVWAQVWALRSLIH